MHGMNELFEKPVVVERGFKILKRTGGGGLVSMAMQSCAVTYEKGKTTVPPDGCGPLVCWGGLNYREAYNFLKMQDCIPGLEIWWVEYVESGEKRPHSFGDTWGQCSTRGVVLADSVMLIKKLYPEDEERPLVEEVREHLKKISAGMQS